jgi:hypothetical protein
MDKHPIHANKGIHVKGRREKQQEKKFEKR